EDVAIARALVRAHERGVDVRVVGDEDNRTGAGFAALEEAGVMPAYGNGELRYLPDPTLGPLLEECQGTREHITCTRATGPARADDGMMIRPGDYNLMSHTFFVVDEVVVWNLTNPLTGDNNYWLGFRLKGEDAARSFAREFQQMYGGVFATTLSVYNGPLKSATHQTPTHYTNQGILRVQFNPQERLVKQIIDEVYRAKASVYIMTEDLANPYLVDALEYKHRNGFDIKLILGESQSPSQFDRLASMDTRPAPDEVDRLPTVVIIDEAWGRDDHLRGRIVQVLSHPLWRGSPFEVLYRPRNDWVRIYPADTFVDGNLWEIVEEGFERAAPADKMVEFWNDVWTKAAP
ncbi:MAG: hypothetical protein ACNA8W_17570, partial [Bradymonadaceae bacterium]